METLSLIPILESDLYEINPFMRGGMWWKIWTCFRHHYAYSTKDSLQN